MPAPKTKMQSKTIWMNVAVLIAGVLGYLQGHEIIAQNPVVVSVLAVAVGISGVVLRLLTDKPIK